MKKYPKYEKTNVKWIGEIPEHWEVKPLFTVLKENKTRNHENKEHNVLSLSYGKIIRRDVESNYGLFPASFENYQVVNDHYIILRLTDLQNDKVSLRVGQVKEKGIITSAYIGLVPNDEIDSGYQYSLLHSYDVKKVFYGFGSGVRQTMSFRELKWLPVLIPPRSEQTAIASYLDHKTTLIDDLIAKNNKLIKLLEEKRKAIINQAVTKGLDPNVKMKDSGVEWTGEIPEHWEVKRMKHIFKYEKGTNAAKYTKEYVDTNRGGYPVFSGQTENNGVMGYVRDFDYDLHNGLLVTTVGAKAMSVRYISGKFCLSQNCALITKKTKNVEIKYYKYYFPSHFQYEKHLLSKIMQPSLRFEDLDRYVLLFPGPTEQTAIASYLDHKTALIDELIEKIKSQNSLLREYRQSLISNAVTGKFDVRDKINEVSK
jgi:type I restriction enzyme, S subunit